MNKILIDGPFIGKVLTEPYTKTVTLEAKPRGAASVAVVEATVYRIFMHDATVHVGFYSCDEDYITEKFRSIACPK